MTMHEYASLDTGWFRRLMELLDGKEDGSVTGTEKREVMGDDYMGALQILTAQNHACHAGILTKDDTGHVRFDREKLDRIIADGKRTDDGVIIAPCVFDCECESE